MAGALGLPCAPAAADGVSLENEVKATYIYKFAPFVTWPTGAATSQTGFTICTSGEDAVSVLIPDASIGATVNGVPVTIRRLGQNDSPASCRILYVATSDNAARMLAAVRGRPVLTITSNGGAVHGIIELRTVGNHVHFIIDIGEAQASGLAISSKLLSLADVVAGKPDRTP